MILINYKSPFACIFTKGVSRYSEKIRESYAFIRERYALFRESFA